ncbi:MAG: stage II sporulation protein M [Bacteroidota bacterium]
MREAVFVKLNGDKWKKIESYINSPIQKNPDTLAGYYIQLTDDLSFARTQYPTSQVTEYLNAISSRAHHLIYINKKERSSRIITFWTREVPEAVYVMRKELLIALLVFSVAVAIGVVSTRNDDTYTRLILGDAYVDMTLDNIKKGDPMGVYASMKQLPMFFRIAFNNIRVSFIAFAAGLLFAFGSGLVLFYNGIMLGSFQYFFYQKGLLLFSFLSIWIHGTIEISIIVVSGAAGIHLGNSFLFPGTLPRIESFTKGARTGTKILIGLIPLFIIAALLESYITRYSHWHWLPKLSIILASLSFIIYYFGILPFKVHRKVHD